MIYKLIEILTFVSSIVYFGFGIILLIGLLKKKSDKSVKANSSKMSVSVIVAARNEEENLPFLLQDLAKQSYQNFEIIVANDRSTDSTQKILEEFSRKLTKLKFVNIEKTPKGVSPKKNALTLAIKKSSGKVLIFTDADCRVEEFWVERLVELFESEKTFVIGFSNFTPNPNSKSELLQNLQILDFLVLMAAAKGANFAQLNWACTGQNLAYSKKLYEEVGGFEKIKNRISGDDVLMLQLARKVENVEIKFAANPQTFTTSYAMPNFQSFWNQRKRWASNSSFQITNNPLFFIYLLSVSTINLGIVISLIIGLYQTFVFVFSAKFLFDFIFTTVSCKNFRKEGFLKFFPIWFLGQFPYIIFVGFFGLLGKFKWKQ